MRWILEKIVEGGLLGIGAYLLVALLGFLSVVRLEPAEEVVVALFFVIAALAYFLVRENQRNRAGRAAIEQLQETQDALKAQGADLALSRVHVEELTRKFAMLAPVAFSEVDKLVQVLDAPTKVIGLSHWWPKGVDVRFEIQSSDNVDGFIAFQAMDTEPLVPAKDYSQAIMMWSESRLKNREVAFTTASSVVWFVVDTWPKGNVWGSDVAIRILERRPVSVS